jgi:Flp pilus assembly protein TadD
MRRAALGLASVLAVLACVCVGISAQDTPDKQGKPDRQPDPSVYRPPLAVPDSFEPFLKYVEPGTDAFPAEKTAIELEARLREFGDALRAGSSRSPRASGDVQRLLAPDFHGGPLITADDVATATSDAPFTVTRTVASPSAPATDRSLDARAFGAEIQRLVADLKAVTITEFQITAIDPGPQPQHSASARTEVRYDIVGVGTSAWRVERNGTWQMTWRRGTSGWQIVEWTAASHATSRARNPVFTEITQGSLGRNESFRRQLNTDLDTWSSRLDSVVTFDSNGHHGVSVGDADGDGLEDLYVAQPAGLPNRLFRARGDGTFEDVTDRAGVGVLDDTTMSLFADVDNDGDEDLVLATRSGLLLFLNDGKGHFTRADNAFQLARPLQGSLTSIAMADYDRDGYLDLYLCVYSYFYGAAEDKGGSPMPYYDARNGPPAVLFHNDGHGHFVDVTQQAGLDATNDHYHFAATWADYDGDGWPDLLVANDFGSKSLYHNRGRQNGQVTFEDVTAKAGVLDHGAGMSAAFVDYDNDGRLDIYTGNMFSASGLRITSMPSFLPDAPADVRALYHRHARGNGLFRNRGDGTFEDMTLTARANMGRWAWSSEALDFDNDGFEDLYIVNGMLTRDGGREDLDSYFWRQVVARSPLTRVKGTPYDDAWRALNHLLKQGSIASRQRNVFLRNDGQGGFDEVSGTVGLDLDQDGRSFAVLDLDHDGRPDLAVMAARQAPQLRLFHNDFPASGTSLAVQLVGKESNRDAVGARVTIETDTVRRTKIVTAGSGFLSQQTKELLFGLGASRQVKSLTVEWPLGRKQVFNDVPVSGRLRLVEGGTLEKTPFAARDRLKLPAAPAPTAPEWQDETWLYEPFPVPDVTVADVRGDTRSLAALRGKPAVVLLWSTAVPEARAAFDGLAHGKDTLARAGIGAMAVVLDSPADVATLRAASSPALPVIVASRELGLSYAILHQHVFMNRLDLHLPTTLLLDAAGRLVKLYRDRPEAARIVSDAAAIDASAGDRISRAVPFAGAYFAPLPQRNYVPYGRDLLDQGLEAPAVTAFEQAAQASPNASTLYRLGTLLEKTGDATKARAAFERALALQPDLAEANNDLGALLAQNGDVEGAIARFRAALATTPEYPDALNNLGFALLITGHDAEARGLYEKALALQPDFPEALNNLGMLAGRAGEFDRAEHYFRDALTTRDDYGEAANNLALVLVARGQRDDALKLLTGFVDRVPHYEAAYLTLAKIYLSGNQSSEGIAVLERLLQRNPAHAQARALLQQFKNR